MFGTFHALGKGRRQTRGLRSGAHYGVSNADLIGLTKILARDFAPVGVDVSVLASGQIDTAVVRLTEDAYAQVVDRIPLGRLGSPDDIAYAALFLPSEQAGYSSGHTPDVKGGINCR